MVEECKAGVISTRRLERRMSLATQPSHTASNKIQPSRFIFLPRDSNILYFPFYRYQQFSESLIIAIYVDGTGVSSCSRIGPSHQLKQANKHIKLLR